MSAQKNLKKNVIFNVLYQVLVLIFPLITSPYIARTLDATQIGSYSYVNTIASYFVLFAMLGLNNYGNRSIARVRDNPVELSKTFSEIHILQLISTLIVTLVYIAVIFHVKDNRILYIIQLIHIASAGLDINWLFYGTENFKLSLERNIVIRIISLASILLFVKRKDDLIVYTLIMCLVNFLSALLLWPFALKIVKYQLPSIGNVFKHLKPNLILFVPIIAISLYKYMDKIMLGSLCEKSEVAFYTYADQIVAIPESFVLAIGTVLMPRISNMMAKGMESENKRLLSISLEFSMLTACAFAFGLSAVGNSFAIVFYGEAFERCGQFIQLLSPVIMFVTWSSTFRTQYIIPAGKDYIYIITVVAGAIVNFIANFLLIPVFQGKGAIFATLLAEIAVCTIQFVFIFRKVNFVPFFKYWGQFALIGVLMYFLVCSFDGLVEPVLLKLVLQVLAGALFYLTCIFLYYRFVRKDMTIVNSILSAIRVRKR